MDKASNATVVMDKANYVSKVTEILSAPTYRPLQKDPTPSVERKIASNLMQSEPSAMDRALILWPLFEVPTARKNASLMLR